MTLATEPLAVASDVHLEQSGSERIAGRLARLFEDNAGREIVLAGDIFNLSVDRPSRDPAESAATTLASYPELVSAMALHLRRGHKLTFVAGNHDAGIMTRGMRERLLALFEVPEATALRIEPWFVRRGDIHIEHGHVYDPDNAPAHPLALWSPETEPLGISLTRRFLSPNDAFTFAHAHHTTPWEGVKHTFKTFKGRAPLMVLQYFATSGRLTAEAAVPERLAAEKARGRAALDGFAQRSGVDVAQVQSLVEALPRPTHEDFGDTFFRLYFDRVLATAGAAAGGLRLLLGGALGAPVGGAVALASALYLHRSIKQGVNRYSDLPVKYLYAGAELVRRVTGAKLVVFGHTHCEDETEGYKNSASFAYTYRKGSPYLRIQTDGSATRCEIS